MSEATEQQNLQGLSIRERRQVKEQFFRLYRKTGNVAESARALDICRRTATRWVKAYKGNGNRVRHEGRHGRRTGEGRALTREQERKLMSMLVDKTPMQYKFPFALWNSRAIRDLIRAEFGVKVSRRTVCRCMARNGFTPQGPEKRAREQRPAQVRRWMERVYPRIRMAAKRVGAEIFRCDGTGVGTRTGFQRGYAPKGMIPLPAVTSVVSCRVSMISAVSNRGAPSFRAYTGPMRMRRFLHFAKAVAHDSAAGKVVLIVDNLRVHHAKLVRAWAARHRDKIKIFYLPAYSPELNPDELVNSDLKIGIGQREPAKDRRELERQVCEHMDGVKANPEKVAAFFQKQSVRYAAD